MTNSFHLRLKFWGVRGSIPTPLAKNLEFGGNTACLEVRPTEDEVLIFDGGTGIRELGVALLKEFSESDLTVKHFLTHFHWDHIQGLPFFAPIYDPDNEIVFHAPNRLGPPKNMLMGQMQAPYFPVSLDLAGAAKDFVEVEDQDFDLGSAMVRPFPLNHPQGATGYRIEREGVVVVYATDLEHGHPELDQVLREYARGADVLIYDAQYTPEEYESHKGWGHSTWREGTRLASECDVGKLILFHHDPAHDDEFMRGMEEEARSEFPETYAAREDWVVEV